MDDNGKVICLVSSNIALGTDSEEKFMWLTNSIDAIVDALGVAERLLSSLTQRSMITKCIFIQHTN